MKIISSIMALLCAHKMCSSTENRSGKNCDDASVHTASGNQDNDYSSVLKRIQTICNVLPGSEMLLDVHNGEICMRLKWNPLVMNNQMPIINKVISAQEISEAEEIPEATAEESATGEPADTSIEKEMNCKDEEKTEKSPFAKLYSFLKKNYIFRYNMLTEQTECAKIHSENKELADENHRIFMPVDARQLNGICLSAMDEGIKCWDRDIHRYVESDKIATYHPFLLYLDNLPKWDGKDRMTELSKRASDSELWVKSFHRWMLAVTAQWMGLGDSKRANSVAPLLVSTRQGWGKSTFCRLLMPDALSRYFTESYDLNSPSSAECKLATFGLINLDEFDKLSVKKMPLLKNLMQMESLNIRKAYKRSTEPLSRIASFIGTSNRRDLLTDATGSRRFICVELSHAIDCSPINHDQLYAQLKEELILGERYWFSKEEEKEIQAANQSFYRSTPDEEVFHSCFRFAEPEEEGARLMTAADIYQVMKKRNPAAMRGTTCNTLSRMLPAMGERVHTRYCNGYWVIELE